MGEIVIVDVPIMFFRVNISEKKNNYLKSI